MGHGTHIANIRVSGSSGAQDKQEANVVSPCNRPLLTRSPWQRESRCRQLPRQAQRLPPRQAPQLQMGHLPLQHQRLLLPRPHPTAPSLPRSTTRAQTAKSERLLICMQRGSRPRQALLWLVGRLQRHRQALLRLPWQPQC